MTELKTLKKDVKCTFRLVGIKGEIIEFKEFQVIMKYMEKKGWKLFFDKVEEGWFVEFRK